MKKLFITLTLLAGTFTPALHSMGCESVMQRQYREMMQNNMLTMVAKAQITIKALVQELQGYQAAFEQIKKLARKHGYQEITQYIDSIENNTQPAMNDKQVAMEDESSDELES